jgi:hypothetical protein
MAPGKTCYITHIVKSPEFAVFTMLLILLVVGITLGIALFVGGRFVQGYIYNDPSPQLAWGAPATAAALFLFYTAWCVAVALTTPTPDDAQYHVIWSFTTTVNQFPTPVKDLWAVRKGGKTEHYVLKKVVMFKGQSRSQYRSAETDKPWNDTNLEAIEIRPAGSTPIRYSRTTEARGAYAQYTSDDGWVITDRDGPAENPEKSRLGRLLLFLFLHVMQVTILFVCLWLLMRFQWGHALVAAVILSAVSSLILLPMLVGYATDVSRARHAPAERVAHAELAPAVRVAGGVAPRVRRVSATEAMLTASSR